MDGLVLVLVPQQRERHALATQLSMNMGPIGYRPLCGQNILWRWVELMLQRGGVQLRRLRPRQPRGKKAKKGNVNIPPVF
jgi:hypothetical protein